jgi:hypothetical protein
VEDSANGMQASVSAGLATVVTVSAYTKDEDFTGASLVVSSLGDRSEPARVLADPLGISPGAQVTLGDLDSILAGARSAAQEDR